MTTYPIWSHVEPDRTGIEYYIFQVKAARFNKHYLAEGGMMYQFEINWKKETTVCYTFLFVNGCPYNWKEIKWWKDIITEVEMQAFINEEMRNAKDD